MTNICEVCGLIPKKRLVEIYDMRVGKTFEVCRLCRDEIRDRNKLISCEAK